jgi:hypothetical protein
MVTAKKITTPKVEKIPEKVIEKVPEKPITKAAKESVQLTEIHDMIAKVDAFYADLENKKRATINQNFQSITDFHNYSEAGKHHKSGLEHWRRFLEK